MAWESVDEVQRALSAVDLKDYPIYLQAGISGIPAAALLFAHADHRHLDLADITGAIQFDPLGTLARDGMLSRTLDTLYDEMTSLVTWTADRTPLLKVVAVRSQPYHDAGANAVEELGFVLATLIEYLRNLTARGLLIDVIAPHILASFSVGSNFFMEVAKLRAARLTWSRVVEAFGGNESSQKMTLHVRCSAWNKTVHDPYVNLLRSTTETFSAVIAGADSIHTSPFDEVIREPDDLARRIARNTQIILREECHLQQVVDPAGGSWYVETLTDALAEKAWALMQEVEREGGMMNALQSGMPQRLITATAKAKAEDIATRKAVFIGTNIYANAAEKPLPSLVTETRQENQNNVGQSRTPISLSLQHLAELARNRDARLLDSAITAAKAGATLAQISRALGSDDKSAVQITPLEVQRGAEPYERLRQAAAQHTARTGHPPGVFLANLGPISQHKARADFTTQFFTVGGFEILDNDGFDTPEEAASAAIASNAPIAVICGTDESYPDLVPRYMAELKKAETSIVVVLAGFPKDQIEALKICGVDEFIHLKSNNYQILVNLLRRIGVVL